MLTVNESVRRDTAPERRVELHAHTTFTTMDACVSPAALIRQAAAWGHRAVAVTDFCSVQGFPEAFRAAEKAGIRLIPGCEFRMREDDGEVGSRIVVLAASQTGITHLYRLVSEALLNGSRRGPSVPRSMIGKYRKGLLLGSACAGGELFRAALDGRDDAELARIAAFYDYLELQPIDCLTRLTRGGAVVDDEALRGLYRRIVRLGEELNLPVCAAGDVHFLNPSDDICRAVLRHAMGRGGADRQPPLYFRSTDEMLEAFRWLGEDRAFEIVVANPNRVADRIGDVKLFAPHPEGRRTFLPRWPGAEGMLCTLVNRRARALYGDPLPEIVRGRIDRELDAIIANGYAALYMIAIRLVDRAITDGYIAGSRGSVGSSLAAFLSGITEVNPLPPHYVCPNCRHAEFNPDARCGAGPDLPPKACPVCGEAMNRDGFDIPCEVFMGIDGDRLPDIDLNLPKEYRPAAQACLKAMLGEGKVFHAGTVGALNEGAARVRVQRYAEDRGIALTDAEEARLTRGITGVKCTTGMHPAGMVILPKEYEIYRFTPIQRPMDDINSAAVTTHFDFWSVNDALVKLDLLGHDVLTMLHNLQGLTGIAPQAVPLNDPEVFSKLLSLFHGPEALGITAERLSVPTGTLGIPEFGTPIALDMLKDIQPRSMEDLIRICALAHSTGAWQDNARDIVKGGVAPLNQCVCARDDIMNRLIERGMERETAFAIMESVRRGRGLAPEMAAAMSERGVPNWFIESCGKIKYLFPRAHVAEYVTMALRVAYFKLYWPAEFYCCLMDRYGDCLDAATMCTYDVPALQSRLRDILSIHPDDRTLRQTDEAELLSILIEMNLRGIRVKPQGMNNQKLINRDDLSLPIDI